MEVVRDFELQGLRLRASNQQDVHAAAQQDMFHVGRIGHLLSTGKKPPLPDEIVQSTPQDPMVRTSLCGSAGLSHSMLALLGTDLPPGKQKSVS